MRLTFSQKGNWFVLETPRNFTHFMLCCSCSFCAIRAWWHRWNSIHRLWLAPSFGLKLCSSHQSWCEYQSRFFVRHLRVIQHARKNYVNIIWRHFRRFLVIFTLVSNSLNCFSRSARYFSISSVASSFACFNLLAFPKIIFILSPCQ